MGKAIKITVKKAHGGHDPSASKFFGAPAVPLDWADDFYDDEIFFCQIRLSDIAKFDTENRLPHTGYLYIFLRTENGKSNLRANARYYEGEPELVIDDFNTAVEEYEQFNDEYLMQFSEAEESEDCTRLLGIPSDWSYAKKPPRLLLQYDPLDSEMGFLDELDGYLYFFFGKNEENFDEITLTEEFSRQTPKYYLYK